jgi:ATP-dependent DNA helicase 2 subunit 1
MPAPETRDYGRDGEDAGEEEEIETNVGVGRKHYRIELTAIKDAVLFAIDISHSMLQIPDSDENSTQEDSAALAALKCAYQLMQQRIISNPSDMMGVLLFGTQESKMGGDESAKASLAYPHCYLLTDLDVPAASDVKKLRSLVRDEEESKELLVPSKDEVAMSNVLFCANQIFTTKAPNFTSRRLFIVTDNDSPHNGDTESRNAAAVRAKDLYDLGVLIELFPIAQSEKEFDRSRFYDVRQNTISLHEADDLGHHLSWPTI